MVKMLNEFMIHFIQNLFLYKNVLEAVMTSGSKALTDQRKRTSLERIHSLSLTLFSALLSYSCCNFDESYNFQVFFQVFYIIYQIHHLHHCKNLVDYNNPVQVYFLHGLYHMKRRLNSTNTSSLVILVLPCKGK